jgi:rhodanese-related sulfurtransferase
MLKQAGFAEVVNIVGGYNAWSLAFPSAENTTEIACTRQ